MVQEKRRFKENVDYITSPGWRLPKWPSGEIVPKKEIYGKYYKGGPSAVITNMGVFRFDENGEMYLDTVHPLHLNRSRKTVPLILIYPGVKVRQSPPVYRKLSCCTPKLIRRVSSCPNNDPL